MSDLDHSKNKQSLEPNKIRYGSIIHLENGAKDGGYLSASRSTIEEDVLNWSDRAVKTFTFTHLFENRVGSSSWEILPDPASDYAMGDNVHCGHRIRLRNMASDAAYLDIFDWVNRLKSSFDDYKGDMQNGAFTLDTDLRPAPHDQPIAEWIIKAAEGENKNGVITEGKNVVLEHNWLMERGATATQLTTFKRVRDNDDFQEEIYAGERMFVFVGDLPDDKADGSNKWEITLSESSRSIYYLWGQDTAGKWIDYGSLHIGALLSKSLVRLKIVRDVGNPQALTGKVVYEGEGAVLFEATRIPDSVGNVYGVKHSLHGTAYDDILKNYPDGEWVFGAERGASIVAIDIASADNGRTFSGTITYEGDSQPTAVRGMQPSSKSFKVEGRPLLYDFFKPKRWEKRIQAIGSALGTSQEDRQEIDDVVTLIDGQTHLEAQDKTNQKHQLKNIAAMKQTMRAFWTAVQGITNGDNNDGLIKKLHQQDILPPVNMISEMIAHMTADLEIVERAMQQRRPSGGYVQSDSLLVADKLAAMSFAPFQGLLADGAVITPVTYFDKSVYVRLVPYSDQFVFIGLTYDLAISADQNTNRNTIPPFALMAIPHEVGHFLYHLQHDSLPGASDDTNQINASLNASRGHKHYRGEGHSRKHRAVRPNTFGWLSNDPAIADNPYHDWCEEIFADLYGCLVSGPFTVLGIQSLLASGDKSRLMRDDVQHPTPILRPYLMSEMLRVLGEHEPEKWGRFQKSSLLLDANWTAVLDRWGIVLEDVYNGRPASIIMPNDTEVHLEPFTRVNIASAIEHGRKIIEHFVKALLNTEYNGEFSSVPWSRRKRTLNGYARIFKAIAENETERIKDVQLDARDSYPVNPETIKALSDVVSADNPNYVEIGENLFKTVRSAWHDGGGTGGSRGGSTRG